MRLLQFIKWWWNNEDGFDKSIAVITIFGVIPAFIVTFVFGGSGIHIFLITTLTVGLFWILYGIKYYLSSLWREFNNACPTEDMVILRKLKGESTPAHRFRNRRSF